jgi:hypothetical protein
MVFQILVVVKHIDDVEGTAVAMESLSFERREYAEFAYDQLVVAEKVAVSGLTAIKLYE